MIKLKKSGFALPLVILMAVVLIVAGGAGYYFYKISQEQKGGSFEEAVLLPDVAEKVTKTETISGGRDRYYKFWVDKGQNFVVTILGDVEVWIYNPDHSPSSRLERGKGTRGTHFSAISTDYYYGYYYIVVQSFGSGRYTYTLTVQVIDETVDLSSKDLSTEGWKVYRNEKYGFEVKYPSYFRLGYITSLGDLELKKIDELNKGLPSFKGVPEDDELYIHVMAFNSLPETSDEPIGLVFTKKDAREERQKLEQSAIGDPWQFRSEKPYGKVIGISERKAAQYLKFSPQWGGYNAYFITYNNDGDRIELSIYLKSLTKEEAEKETRNVIFSKIFSTFKFIEK